MFIDLHRKIVLVFLKAEAPGHTAAAVIEDFSLRAHGIEELLFGIEADDGFLVTMPVNHDVLMQAWWPIVLPRQEFCQSEGLTVQALGILVMRAQVEHLDLRRSEEHTSELQSPYV